jgi:hypothetical protein
MHLLFATTAALLTVSLPLADAPLAMWRFEDAGGIFGVRLNRDGSCQALIAPKGGRADVFACTYEMRGAGIALSWRSREDRREAMLPTQIIHLPVEDTIIVPSAPDKPLKRVGKVLEFLAL